MPNQLQSIVLVVFALMALVLLVAFVIFLRMFQLWLRALLSGVKVSVFDIIGMQLRGNSPRLLIDALISLKYRGVNATIRQIEMVYLADRGTILNSSELADRVQQSPPESDSSDKRS